MDQVLRTDINRVAEALGINLDYTKEPKVSDYGELYHVKSLRKQKIDQVYGINGDYPLFAYYANNNLCFQEIALCYWKGGPVIMTLIEDIAKQTYYIQKEIIDYDPENIKFIIKTNLYDKPVLVI